jgi:hypothetical protein
MPDDNGLGTFENEEIAAAMRKRGKEKLGVKEMHEVMDAVNPEFWAQWKATEKRISVDAKHVKCDYCDAIVYVVRPSKDGKRAMCNTCATRLTSRERVIILPSDPLVVSSNADNSVNFSNFKKRDEKETR